MRIKLLVDYALLRGGGRAFSAAIRYLPREVRTALWKVYGKMKGPKAAPVAGSGFGALSRAEEFGIRPYRELRKLTKGTGLEAHHLIEQRFSRVMQQDPKLGLSIAVTPSEHQVFTKAWRKRFPYGIKSRMVTRQELLEAAREIYSDYPAILHALGL